MEVDVCVHIRKNILEKRTEVTRLGRPPFFDDRIVLSEMIRHIPRKFIGILLVEFLPHRAATAR